MAAAGDEFPQALVVGVGQRTQGGLDLFREQGNGLISRIPDVGWTYVARIEDVLDLYAEAPDPAYSVVCFDESPTQLIVRPASQSRLKLNQR